MAVAEDDGVGRVCRGQEEGEGHTQCSRDEHVEGVHMDTLGLQNNTAADSHAKACWPPFSRHQKVEEIQYCCVSFKHVTHVHMLCSVYRDGLIKGKNPMGEKLFGDDTRHGKGSCITYVIWYVFSES